jgi:hypothetical protein
MNGARWRGAAVTLTTLYLVAVVAVAGTALAISGVPR